MRGYILSEPKVAAAYKALREAIVSHDNLISATAASKLVGCTPKAIRQAVYEGRLLYATGKLLDRRDVLEYRDRVSKKGNARRGQHIRRTKHGVIDNSRMNR